MKIRRVFNKLCEANRWINSVGRKSSIPAAVLLSQCHRRGPGMTGAYSRILAGLRRRVEVYPKSLQGLAITLDTGDLSRLLLYEEAFIEELYDFSTIPFTPNLVVDCGGFEGYFSLLASVAFPGVPIIAFEPHPRNYKTMCSNFERNGVRIETRQEAVSISNTEDYIAGASCVGHLNGKIGGEPTRVKGVDLTEILSKINPTSLLLKIDIEGEEKAILPNIVDKLPQQCALFFEWHHEKDLYQEIRALLQARGFTVLQLRVRKAPESEAKVYLDAFAIRSVNRSSQKPVTYASARL